MSSKPLKTTLVMAGVQEGAVKMDIPLGLV